MTNCEKYGAKSEEAYDAFDEYCWYEECNKRGHCDSKACFERWLQKEAEEVE